VRDPTQLLEVHEMLKDEQIKAVFLSLEEPPNSGNGLPYNRISRALEALSYSSPDPALIKTTLRTLMGREQESKHPLEHAEFCVIVFAFYEKRQQELQEQFKLLDSDGSGTISSREFRHLLWEQGYTVGPETVEEIFSEVDEDGSGLIEFAEFKKAVQVVRTQHGFTRKEIEELFRVFDRYDTDKSGEISADELASALGWFGTATSISGAQEILARFDNNSDGTLCRPEFLMVIRNRLEEEASEIRTLFSEVDANSTGTMTSAEVAELFLKVGYTIQHDIIEEACKQLGPSCKSSRLVFEDVTRLLTQIRKNEGFSVKEVDELLDVYRRFDSGGQSQMREHEVARALTWLGYPISQKRRRLIWVKVDVDKTNTMNEGEFLKFIRFIREQEIECVKEFLNKPGTDRVLHERDLKDLLSRLGYAPAHSLLMQALKMSTDSTGDGLCDVLGVLNVLSFIREGSVTKLRQSAGLPDHQATKVVSKFGLRIDAGKRIEPAEFERFMYELFKTARQSLEERDRIKHVIKDHCQDGTLDMMGAYWVVRTYGDMCEEDAWRREQVVAEAAHFTPPQVAQFRQAFYEADQDGCGFLREDEVLALFDDIMVLSLTQAQILKNELLDLGEGSESIDFPDFLHLMGVVLGQIDESDHTVRK